MKITVTTDRWFQELPLTDKVIEHIGVKVVTTKQGFTEYRFEFDDDHCYKFGRMNFVSQAPGTGLHGFFPMIQPDHFYSLNEYKPLYFLHEMYLDIEETMGYDFAKLFYERLLPTNCAAFIKSWSAANLR